jgi:hypothetical protein
VRQRHILLLAHVLSLFGCQGQSYEQQCIGAQLNLEKSALSAIDYSRLEDPPFKNSDREEAVTQYFAELCPQFQLQKINYHNGHNVICRIPGASQNRIIVGAHYDRIGTGRGVADNWSGIVLVSRLISEINSLDLNFTWEIVAFGAEEIGLLGSKTFIREAVRDKGLGDILAMINVDTLGLGTVKIDSRSHESLKCQTKNLADKLGIELEVVSLPTITGDWEPFWRKNIPVLSMHSLDRQSLHRVHNRKDSRQAISEERLEDAWLLLRNLQRNFDQSVISASN